MKLLLDVEGKVNYDKISEFTTVQDVLDAIEIFLNDHPLPCEQCEDSCCKKSWSVEMDNVCVNRLCNWDSAAAEKFIDDKLVIKENYALQFDQYILNKDTNCKFITESNLCTVYEQRPVICRLFICSAKSYRYNLIRGLIAATYLKALVIEEKLRKDKIMPGTDNHYPNPAVYAKDYNMLMAEIINYSYEEGWLESEDIQGLYSHCK
jgi:Fe-S-cluster containining protein